MEEKLITIAIHSPEKAAILHHLLESEGIDVFLEEIDKTNMDDESQTSVSVRIKSEDLAKSINIIESRHLFPEKYTSFERKDDGRPRILVPVDFSEYSMKACEIAFNMAKALNAKIKILHVYFNPYYPTALPISDVFVYEGKDQHEFRNVVKKVKENIHNLCKKIDNEIKKGNFPPVNYSYVLREGLPEEEIVEFSKDYNPILIIMGTRGKDQKDVDLIGSVTAEVIEMSKIPVLALPEKTPFKDIRQVSKMVYLTSFSERDLLAFDKMIDLIEPYKMEVEFVLANFILKKSDQKDEDFRNKLKDYFKKKHPALKLTLKFVDAEDLVEDLDSFIKEEKADILAVTSSRRNIFFRMFMPSIPRKVLSHSDIPLFVIKG